MAWGRREKQGGGITLRQEADPVPEGGRRFLRSQLRRIGLGHPLGRDPLRTSMPAGRN